MTYYFISFAGSELGDFAGRIPALADGVWIDSEEVLETVLKSGGSPACFFVGHTGKKDLDKCVLSIRGSLPAAKIVYVTTDLKASDMKTHQLSPVGGDAYVSRQVGAETLDRILAGFRSELTNKRGNKLETTGAHLVSNQFQLSSLMELKELPLSRKLDQIFQDAIPQKAAKPKFQSLANLAPDDEESGVEIMTDKDKELSLSSLDDLELSDTPELPPEAPAEDTGMDLNLDGGLDLNLADDLPAPDAEAKSDVQLSGLGELDLGSEEDFNLGSTSTAVKKLPTAENDDASGLVLSDGTNVGLDFGPLDGEISPDAKEKLAEIDAIMEEDSKIHELGGDMDLLGEAADLMTGTGKPAAEEVIADADSLDFGTIDDSLAESTPASGLDSLSLDGDNQGFEIADVPAAGTDDRLDSDLDQPLVSDDLDLASLDFGAEAAEETVVAVKKAKPPVAPEVAEEEPQLAQEKEKTSTKIRKKKEKEEREPVRASQVDRPVGEELREISGAYSAELERMQATLSNLRADREELLKKIQTHEEEKIFHNRQTLSLRAELDEKKIELSIVRKKLNEDISELKDRVRLEEERRLILEEKNRVLREELDKSAQKNKIDVKKVQLRERELEQKLELLKADAETQIRNRDLKILELKRKIDAMEFDMESMQTQEKRTVESRFELEDKLEKAIKTLRSAISVLEDETDKGAALDALKKNIEV